MVNFELVHQTKEGVFHFVTSSVSHERKINQNTKVQVRVEDSFFLSVFHHAIQRLTAFSFDFQVRDSLLNRLSYEELTIIIINYSREDMS